MRRFAIFFQFFPGQMEDCEMLCEYSYGEENIPCHWREAKFRLNQELKK